MLGIIGGTGLYQWSGLERHRTEEVATPFGRPSAPVHLGFWAGQKVAFLPRHGSAHQLLPGEINFRANIWALKSLGVTSVVSVSAVGSLAEEVRPGELAVPSQYLDFTKGRREATFFGGGLVAHISTAEPTCRRLSDEISASANAEGRVLHRDRVYACVEGPRLGNRAESHLFRQNGAHLVGMTNVPEVYLAREAQLCYATIAVVTDYDCWMEDPAHHVTVPQVIERYRSSLAHVQKIVSRLMAQHRPPVRGPGGCPCRSALEGAVMTPESALSADLQQLLGMLRR